MTVSKAARAMCPTNLSARNLQQVNTERPVCSPYNSCSSLVTPIFAKIEHPLENFRPRVWAGVRPTGGRASGRTGLAPPFTCIKPRASICKFESVPDLQEAAMHARISQYRIRPGKTDEFRKSLESLMPSMLNQKGFRGL